MPNLNSTQGPLTVQVAVRVRPIQPNERLKGTRGNTEVLGYTPEAPIISVVPHNRQFTYDHVFGPDAGQNDIYSQSVLQLMDKFTQGFNATILAYGQTSSGKTFTMGTGSRKHIPLEAQGIIPRAVSTLFDLLKNSPGNFQVRVSYLEIYNEELIDLLAAYEGMRSQVNIREDPRGNIYWTGVKEAVVYSLDDVLNYLECGSLARQTGATEMNEKSSRSHAIFSISLRQEKMVDTDTMGPSTPTSPTFTKKSLNEGDKLILNSKFHFVDLAGSERLKRTNAIGERAKEGISINAGLLALGNVISALGDQSKKNAHVPYRDSKLTRLLQDSLGGNSYTLMIACVSPVESNLNETLNTLQYANRARNIKNQVVLNSELSGDVDYLRTLVKKLKEELRAIKGESRISDDIPVVSPEQENVIAALKLRTETLEQDLLQVDNNYNSLLQHYNQACFDLAKLRAEHQQLKKRIAREKEASEDFQKDVEPIIEEYEKYIETLEGQLQDARYTAENAEINVRLSLTKLKAAQSENELNEVTVAELKAQLSHVEDEYSDAVLQIEELQHQIMETRNIQSEGTKGVQEYLKMVEELKIQLEQSEIAERKHLEKVNELEEKLDQSIRQAQESARLAESLLKELAESNSRIESLEKDLSDVHQERLAQVTVDQPEKLEQAYKELEESELRNQTYAKQVKELEEALAQAQNETTRAMEGSSHVEELENEVSGLKATIDSLQKDKIELNTVIQDLNSTKDTQNVDDLFAEDRQIYDQKIASLESMITSLGDEKSQLEEAKLTLKKDLTELKEIQVCSDNQRIEALTGQIETLESTVNSLTKQNEDYRNSIDTLEKTNEELRHLMENNLSQARDDSSKQIEELNIRVESLETLIASADVEKEMHLKTIAQLEDSKRTLEEDLNKNVESKQIEFDARQTTLTDRIAELENTQTILELSNKAYTDDIKTMEQFIEELDVKNRNLAEQIMQFQEYKSESGVSEEEANILVAQIEELNLTNEALHQRLSLTGEQNTNYIKLSGEVKNLTDLINQLEKENKELSAGNVKYSQNIAELEAQVTNLSRSNPKETDRDQSQRQATLSESEDPSKSPPTPSPRSFFSEATFDQSQQTGSDVDQMVVNLRMKLSENESIIEQQTKLIKKQDEKIGELERKIQEVNSELKRGQDLSERPSYNKNINSAAVSPPPAPPPSIPPPILSADVLQNEAAVVSSTPPSPTPSRAQSPPVAQDKSETIALRSKVVNLEKDLENHVTAIGSLENSLSESEARQNELQTTVNDLRKNVGDHVAKNEKLGRSIEELKIKVESARKELEQERAKGDSLAQRNTMLEARIEELLVEARKKSKFLCF
ncbi:hypothetical protein K7432_010746 [Basidiobolus ranarum]|uniref:Kinesin motor domain-containing protein n=1 Tax=Basidiobolus ranarum TaxID=34480 RepID=A0ABR2WNB3_9FUNG